MDLLIRRKLRDQFAKSSQEGPALLAFLDDNGLELNRIEVLRDGPDFFAYLALSPHLQNKFGLSGDELLLLVLHQPRQEQWFLSEIRSNLRQQNRVTKSAVLVFSPDERVPQLCRAAFSDGQSGYKTAHIAITFKEIQTTKTAQDRATLLYGAFSKQAFVIDHFDTRGPVPDDLFGRNTLIAQIEADIRFSSEGVAILGIRRVGKTSVLKRVLAQLQSDPEEWWTVGYYDAQGDTVEANLHTVTSRLQASLRAAAVLMSRPVPAMPKNLSAPDQLRAVVDHLITQEALRVALAIDEIEWLVPIPTSPNAQARGDDALILFGLLRSLKQQYGNRLALVLCGINETLCEMPQINSRPNPNLDWYRPHYITLLPREDTFEMLRALGHRMGIELTDEFLNRVWASFGGHAYLTRQFCSEAAKKVPQRPGSLTQSSFESTYTEFMTRASIIFEDILKHLAQFYPEEYELLRKVAIGANTQPRTGMAIKHLRSYGLTKEQDGKLTLSLSALAEFVSTHSAEDVQRERFKLITTLGGGATSTVWKAWDNDSQANCALKIFQGGIPEEAIHNEYKLMVEMVGRYTPRPLGVVKYEGQLAIAMDFVGGVSLETILRSGKKILGDDLIQFSYHLFESLEAIHPQIDKLQKLIESGEMSALGSIEYFELKKRGHLHRDLKPANIVVVSKDSWELKLIDLGLATSADRAGLSRVGTPDYSPPDLGVSRWDSSFDLYALGRILTQCVFGQLVSYEDVDNACKDINPQHQDTVRAFFKKALNPSSSQRYTTVKSMKNDWENAILAFVYET